MWRISQRKLTCSVMALAGLLVHQGSTFARQAPPEVLDPKTYTSPSGQFKLVVDPSDMNGAGSATYRLKRDGREVWSASKPFTLWDACVTDEGVVGGYAYSKGFDAFRDYGDFRVAIIESDGRVRMDQVTKREGSHFLHTPPNPIGVGMLMDPANDRLIIRIENADPNLNGESWSVYRISTGTLLATFHPFELMPDSKPMHSSIPWKDIGQVGLVAKTPLTLVYWRCNDSQRRERLGSRFTLIDVDGSPVWTLDLPGRCAIVEGTKGEGRFALLDGSTKQKIEFSATLGVAGKWDVIELHRDVVPQPLVEPAQAPPAIPDRPLKLLGRMNLRSQDGVAPSRIQRVSDFAFDGRGRFALLEGKDDEQSLELVDDSGTALASLPLDSSKKDDENVEFKFACVGGDRFVVIKARYLNGTHSAQAWWADFGKKTTTPIDGVHREEVGYVAGFPDGGFVIGAWVSDDGITAYDALGKGMWSHRADYNSKPRDLLPSSPIALTITTKGEVAALENDSKILYRFDRMGRHLGTIDLKKAWGREPKYPTGIEADVDGGYIITDFNGSPPIVRMRADGTVRAQFQPKHPDGRFTGDDVKAAPDGRLWTSDGYALLRLDDSGVVDRVIGDAPNPQRLGQIGAIAFDRTGKIYAVDERTGAVHVFDPQGRWLHVCVPSPDDFHGSLILPQITVSDDAQVYLRLGGVESDRDGQYLHFSAEGKRMGAEKLELDQISQDWYFQPRTGNRWVVAYNRIFLVDRAGTVLKSINRCPNEDWLGATGHASVAPDGSLAVVARGSVNLYSATGAGTGTIPIPNALHSLVTLIAYDGKRVAIAEGKTAVLLDVSGKEKLRFSLGERSEDEPFFEPVFGLEARELLVFDGRRTIIRYELPED